MLAVNAVDLVIVQSVSVKSEVGKTRDCYAVGLNDGDKGLACPAFLLL